MTAIDRVGIVPPWLGGTPPLDNDDVYLPVLPVVPQLPGWDIELPVGVDEGDLAMGA